MRNRERLSLLGVAAAGALGAAEVNKNKIVEEPTAAEVSLADMTPEELVAELQTVAKKADRGQNADQLVAIVAAAQKAGVENIPGILSENFNNSMVGVLEAAANEGRIQPLDLSAVSLTVVSTNEEMGKQEAQKLASEEELVKASEAQRAEAQRAKMTNSDVPGNQEVSKTIGWDTEKNPNS